MQMIDAVTDIAVEWISNILSHMAVVQSFESLLTRSVGYGTSKNRKGNPCPVRAFHTFRRAGELCINMVATECRTNDSDLLSHYSCKVRSGGGLIGTIE